MKKPHEQEWTTKQTNQGTWVMVDNGHAPDPLSEAVAMVYLPEAKDTEGSTLAQRINHAESIALDSAKMMAAAPDMARALFAHGTEDVRGVWHSRKCIAMGREALCSDECRMDRAALRKAGVLP